MSYKYYLQLILVFFCFVKLQAQTFKLSDKAAVSIITCGSGGEMYSLFGHTAIRVSDTSNNIDLVYNYGTFDFNTPNFYLKFFKGDLQYFATCCTYDEFLYGYLYEKRNVSEQYLNINQNEKQIIFDNLNSVLNSDDKFYTYKFIDKNCTTMVIDIVNKSLGSAIISKKNTQKSNSYRSILYPYFNNHFYENLGISLLFGYKVDHEQTHLFLPSELEKNISQVSLKNGNKLCLSTNNLLDFKPQQTPFSWWNNIYSLIIILGSIVLVNNTKINLIYFSILGLLGCFFTFAGFYSLHKEVLYNYNTLLCNPILLLVCLFYIRKKWNLVYYSCIAVIACLCFYLLVMINKIHLFAVLPIIITTGIIIFKTVKLSKKHNI